MNSIDNLVERLEADNKQLRERLHRAKYKLKKQAIPRGWQTEPPLTLEREALVVCIEDTGLDVYLYKFFSRYKFQDGWGWYDEMNACKVQSEELKGYEYYKVLLLPEKK